MAKNKKPDRRSMTRLIALILCVLLAGSAIVGALYSMGYAEEAPGNHTQLTLTVDEGAQGLRAFQITRYVNRTGKKLRQVLFFLGANSYRRPDTAPFDAGQWETAYPDGFNAGGAQLDSVTVDGQDANWGVRGAGETFVRVDCAIEPGQSATFTFAYQVLLPSAQGKLGAGEMGWRLGYFTVAPCAYEGGDFACVDLRGVGDSAFYEKQDLAVTVDAPSTYLVSSGGKAQRAVNGARAVTTIELPGASNLALALSRRYTQYEGASQGVALRCYANTAPGAKRALQYAQRILAVYGERLGGCPVDQIAIAQVDGVQAVEAYDGLLMVDKGLFAPGRGAALEKALAEGLAKQWFGLAVRTSPEKEPWLSDGICAYLSLLYYEGAYGHDKYLQMLNGQVKDALSVTIPGGLDPSAQRSQFAGGENYDLIIKDRGAAVFNELAGIAGQQGMWDTFKYFYQDNKGTIAHKAQLEAAMEKATGQDLSQALAGHMQSIAEYVNQRIEWLE